MPTNVGTGFPPSSGMVEGLLFNKQKHIYGLDGRVVPSVSEIIKPLHNVAYGELTEEGKMYMREAAVRGSKVHAATENYDKYGNCEIDEDLVPYFLGYLKFLEENNVRWTDIERMGVEPNGIFAGTLDRVGFINDAPAILDIKTTSDISGRKKLVYAAQLTAYRRILGYGRGDIALYILQLTKNGEYRLFEVADEDELLDSCVYIYYKFNTRRRKFEYES